MRKEKLNSFKNLIKKLKSTDKNSVSFSNKLRNLFNGIQTNYNYINIDDFDNLINSIKKISSIFFPNFINFNRFEKKLNFSDPIYEENIQVHGDLLPLIYSPPLQRLNHIRQLSFAYLEYKGANHTRFDHSLGVYHLTNKTYDCIRNNCQLNKKKEDLNELLISSLFHDIGHSPFSHSLEYILNDLDLNDKLFAKRILLDYYKEYIENNLGLNIRNILINISPINDIRKIKEKQQIFKTLIDGALDVDRVDYIRRDYFYCLGNPPGFSHYLSEAGYCKDDKRGLSMFALRDSSDSIQWIRDIDESRRNAYKRIYESDFSAYSDEILIHALYFFCKKYIKDLKNNFEKIKILINELIKLSDSYFISILYLLGDENTKDLLKKLQSREFFKKICYIDIHQLKPDNFNTNFFNFTLRGKENELRALDKIEYYEYKIKNDLSLRGNVFICLPKVYIPSDKREKLCEKNPDLICVPLVKSFKELNKFRLYHSTIKGEIKILPTRRQEINIYLDNRADLNKCNKILNKLCELIIHGFDSIRDFKKLKGFNQTNL